MRRGQDDGVILINVLIVLGLAATIVYAMLTLTDFSIARSQRFSEAGQALALVRGGENSAIAALRRDLIDAPDTDHPGEAWSDAAQTEIAVPGGSFELSIEDAQGLYNLNTLVGGGLQALDILNSIAAAIELPPETTARIVATLTLDGPLRRVAELGPRAGLSTDELAALATVATALPGLGEVNLNAAPQPLLEVLLKNPIAARNLVSRRARAGFLTPTDIETAAVLAPPGVGFRSDLFRVRTRVRIGETVQSVESLLLRRTGPAGPEVVVIDRRNETAAVLPPPPSS